MGDLWRRIGTRDAITWVTVAVYYPLALGATLFGSGAPRGTHVGLLLLASALASTAALAWLGLARLLIFELPARREARIARADPVSQGGQEKDRAEPSRPVLVLCSFAGAVVIRSAATGWLLVAFGLLQQPHFVYRLVASIPSTGVGLAGVAVIVSLARDYSRSLAELRRTQREFGELARSHMRLIEAERTRVIEFAREDLKDRLRGLSRSAAPEALVRVRAAIEELVRPLSRRLNEADPATLAIPMPEIASPGWRAMLRALFSENPLRPISFTVWMTVSSLFAAPMLWGPAEGAVFTIMTAISTLAWSAIGAWGWRRLVRTLHWGWQSLYFSVVALCSGLTVGFASESLSPRIAEHGPAFPWILAALSLLGGWLLATLFALLRQNGALTERRRETERHLHRERVRLHSLYRAEMRSLARVLHGPVQDALSVAGFRIRAAIDAEEPPVAFAELLAEVERSVDAAAARIETVDRQAADSESVLHQIAELWDGLATVRWRLSDAAREALAAHTATRLGFNELVREACANAIRHGEATEIEIFAHEVEISPGLGTRLLEELTLAWRREPGADGTVLTARLLLVD